MQRPSLLHQPSSTVTADKITVHETSLAVKNFTNRDTETARLKAHSGWPLCCSTDNEIWKKEEKEEKEKEEEAKQEEEEE